MKTVLITGASRGIGREIALRFAREGYNIVLNYNSSEAKAKTIAKHIEDLGVKCLLVKADVSVESDVNAMVDTALNTFGKIDVLVNNAGITATKSILDMDDNDFESVININLTGPFKCIREVARVMKENGGGSSACPENAEHEEEGEGRHLGHQGDDGDEFNQGEKTGREETVHDNDQFLADLVAFLLGEEHFHCVEKAHFLKKILNFLGFVSRGKEKNRGERKDEQTDRL